MKFRHFRSLSLGLLFVLMATLGTWSFSGARILHELQHAGHAMQAATAGHGHVYHAHEHGAAGETFLDEADHGVLHAAGLVQPGPLSASIWQPPLKGGAIAAGFISRKLAQATREPPFRPPRLLQS